MSEIWPTRAMPATRRRLFIGAYSLRGMLRFGPAARAVTLHSWHARPVAASVAKHRLRLGKLDRFSLETLVRYLHRLRFRVSITVEPERLGARAPSERRRQGPMAGAIMSGTT